MNFTPLNQTQETIQESPPHKLRRYIIRGTHGNYFIAKDYEIKTDVSKEVKKFLNVFFGGKTIDKDWTRKYPVTRINRVNIAEELKESFIIEFNVCAALKHTALNPVLDYVIDTRDNEKAGLFIVYKNSVRDYFDNYISNSVESAVNDIIMIKILLGVISALSYLHSNGIVAGDLRPGTIFLNSRMEPLLINYNLPQLYPCPLIPYEVKKSEYSAPELADEYKITEKSDVFSFGVLLSKVYSRLMYNEKNFLKRLKNLYKECTSLDPSQRPKSPQVEKMLFEINQQLPYTSQPLTDYYYNIIKSCPESKTNPRQTFQYNEYADNIMESVEKKIDSLKNIVPNKILVKCKQNIYMRALLISLIERNTEAVCIWILSNYKNFKMQDIYEIIDAIIQTTVICYQKVDIYAKLAKNLYKTSLPSNKLGFIPTIILHKLFTIFMKHDPYPNYMPYVSFLHSIYRRKIINIHEILQMVKDIYEQAPSPTFAIPLYIWFNKEIKEIDPDFSQKMIDLIEKTDVRPVFKSFISGEGEISQLSSIIMADNHIAFKNYMTEHPEAMQQVINPTVFEVCPYAQDNISVPMYVLLYNANKIYTYISSASRIYECDNDTMMQMALIGNHTSYLENHKLNLNSQKIMEYSVKFHNYTALLQEYEKGMKPETTECVFSSIKFNNLISLLLILSISSKNGVNKVVNAKEHFGKTLFHAAVENGDYLFLRLLLSISNIKPFKRDSWGRNSLHWAAIYGCDSPDKWSTKNTVRYPWWFGADSEKITGENIKNLSDMFRRYQFPGSFATKLLSTQQEIDPYSSFKENKEIQEKLSTTTSNSEIWSASNLTFNKRFGSPHLMKLLLNYNSKNINDKDEYGMTPLHYAAENGELNVMKVLFSKIGLDPNLKDEKGRTPLHICAKNDDADCFTFLLKSGKVKPEIEDNKKRTAYEVAVANNSFKVLNAAEDLATNGCRI